jgi:hypothetical protein
VKSHQVEGAPAGRGVEEPRGHDGAAVLVLFHHIRRQHTLVFNHIREQPSEELPVHVCAAAAPAPIQINRDFSSISGFNRVLEMRGITITTEPHSPLSSHNSPACCQLFEVAGLLKGVGGSCRHLRRTLRRRSKWRRRASRAGVWGPCPAAVRGALGNRTWTAWTDSPRRNPPPPAPREGGQVKTSIQRDAPMHVGFVFFMSGTCSYLRPVLAHVLVRFDRGAAVHLAGLA